MIPYGQLPSIDVDKHHDGSPSKEYTHLHLIKAVASPAM